jgi:hypothetical protein
MSPGIKNTKIKNPFKNSSYERRHAAFSAYNPSTQKVEAGGSRIQSQNLRHSEILSLIITVHPTFK